MSETILEQYTLKTETTQYLLQVYTDAEGLFRWRIMWGSEEVGSCNQGYKSKSSILSNITKQATLLSMYNSDLVNEIE
jgi:uncharacterized protein YegP (UPF0339 family)